MFDHRRLVDAILAALHASLGLILTLEGAIAHGIIVLLVAMAYAFGASRHDGKTS